MELHVAVDREVCMGSGNCVYEAPGVYDLDGDGVALVLDAAGSPEENILAAARKCPTQAITVQGSDMTSGSC